jgi:WG containing repeat
MKSAIRLLLFLLICLFADAALAQKNPAIPVIPLNTQRGDRLAVLKYKNGADSIRYGITGKGDTFRRQYFNDFGQLESQVWSKDSSFLYDVAQNVVAKAFNFKLLERNGSGSSAFVVPVGSDSIIFKSRQIYLTSVAKHTPTTYHQTVTTKDGEVISSYQGYRTTLRNDTTGEVYEVAYERGGVKVRATQRQRRLTPKDSSMTLWDTLFYTNGQAARISELYRKDSGSVMLLRYDQYNEQGILSESVPSDSVRLLPFKDNIACLYGLRNLRGDTVVTPRYEYVSVEDINRLTAVANGTAVLLRADGSLVPTPKAAFFGDAEKLEDLDKAKHFNDKKYSFYMTSYYMSLFDETPDEYNLLTNKRLALSNKSHFFYNINGKKGIIDRNGKVIMAAQKYTDLGFSPIDTTSEEYFSTNQSKRLIAPQQYISFTENVIEVDEKGDTTTSSYVNFLNTDGKRIFDATVQETEYTNYKDYFVVTQKHTPNDGPNHKFNRKGVYRAYNQPILPCVFEEIQNLTPLFLVTKMNRIINDELDDAASNEDEEFDEQATEKKVGRCAGLFNAESNQWLLDTAEVSRISVAQQEGEWDDLANAVSPGKVYFLYKSRKTHKYGLIDVKGETLLPCVYDTLVDFDNNGLFYYTQNGRYNVFNAQAPKFRYLRDYTFLSPFNIVNKLSTALPCFLARNQAGKWGIIRAEDEQILCPFDYDYVSTELGNPIVMVKNNRAIFYYRNQFVSDTVMAAGRFGLSTYKEIKNYVETLNTKTFFGLEWNGKITLPPKYRYVNDKQHYIVMREGEKGKEKFFIKETMAIEDASEINKIRYYQGNDRIIVINESDDDVPNKLSATTKKMLLSLEDVVPRWEKTDAVYARRTGKRIAPTLYYHVRTQEKAPTIFFARVDTPKLAKVLIPDEIDDDTLSYRDEDWRMFDSTGRLINATPFRFPIAFQDGLGVGMQGENMGIFRTDGTALLEPRKQKIWRDDKTGFFYRYAVEGLSGTISVLDKTGKTIIASAPYEAITPFRGHYTLVKVEGKVGLIDTAGNEIVAPQDLMRYSGRALLDSFLLRLSPRALLDSSNLDSARIVRFALYNDKTFDEDAPQKEKADSNRIQPSLRGVVGNLVLASTLRYFMNDASSPLLNRIGDRRYRGGNSYEDNDDSKFYDYSLSTTYFGAPVVVTGKAPSIAFQMKAYPVNGVWNFNNYIFRKDHWELLQNSAFLQLVGGKRTDFYNLLVKKIKALEGVEIDCGNSADLLQQAQTQFLLQKDGIQIFLRSGDKNSYEEIELTWAELKGFFVPWD